MSSIEAVSLGALIGASYLLGSIPFALLIGRRCGVDIRRAGSGNIGATNLTRLVGWRVGVPAFVLDVLKGTVPMLAARVLFGRLGWTADADHAPRMYCWWLMTGGAAILGHVFPVYLGFRGGKGVATSLGVVLGLWPYYTLPGLACFALWIVVFVWSRYVALASVVAATAFPPAYLGLGLALSWGPSGRQLPLLVFAVVMALLVVYRHRSNLQRLLAGQENRFGARPPSGAEGSAA